MLDERGVSMKEGQTTLSPRELQRISELAKDLAYGTISLVFQDGKLVQIERHEKIRCK